MHTRRLETGGLLDAGDAGQCRLQVQRLASRALQGDDPASVAVECRQSMDPRLSRRLSALQDSDDVG